MYHNMFSGDMWFGWIFWIILVAVIVGLVVAILNRSRNKIQYYSENETPIDILKKNWLKERSIKKNMNRLN